MVFYFVWERTKPKIEGAPKPASHMAAIKSGKRPTFTSRTPPEVRKLISDCWATSPEDRVQADSVVKRWKRLMLGSSWTLGCGSRLSYVEDGVMNPEDLDASKDSADGQG